MRLKLTLSVLALISVSLAHPCRNWSPWNCKTECWKYESKCWNYGPKYWNWGPEYRRWGPGRWNWEQRRGFFYFLQNYPKQNLSQEEIKGLLHMREEEKLARDVYLTLYNKWKLPIFLNIARSEQRHMDAIKYLLEKYGLKDPIAKNEDKIGYFSNPEFQKLYKDLVNQGSKSLIDALKVGALIEELDIKDLKDHISKTDNKDIAFVFQNLMKGSRNHLRAFVRVLYSFGGNYSPKYISQQEFETIINSPMERGPVGIRCLN